MANVVVRSHAAKRVSTTRTFTVVRQEVRVDVPPTVGQTWPRGQKTSG